LKTQVFILQTAELGLTYVEAEIVQAKLPHRPGEIARVASRLGEANINYAYCGLKPDTNMPLVFFGVTDVSKATRFLSRPQPQLQSLRLRKTFKPVSRERPNPPQRFEQPLQAQGEG